MLIKVSFVDKCALVLSGKYNTLSHCDMSLLYISTCLSCSFMDDSVFICILAELSGIATVEKQPLHELMIPGTTHSCFGRAVSMGTMS